MWGTGTVAGGIVPNVRMSEAVVDVYLLWLSSYFVLDDGRFYLE
jgi:hypothetical protein